ncbi:MAG: Uma2 family endonuclease [Saprospiraceae bacterium]|nr:Uma2 family endonuclease [Saprospiraceae bacterium]MCF8249135.1 Uma2 family endonuclease [Saprospiraceae bacterium]MCF8281392.1 Uma2 family endonuclease [Bacteroidales bacterium]MCF8311157.1 Uma2 family endonuclease [Saprospiraceae bacterium]MCF8440247.1 Uma2 family endonuclease [Saprospiraceae bacterium]
MVDTSIRQKRYSLDEYFALEEKAEEKHEYHNGKIITMAGGSTSHSKIAVNITRALDNWIKAQKLPLIVLNSDTKIRIQDFNRNFYPDALVVCEKVNYWNGRTDIITNPVLIFEVLSESTEHYDREDKFRMYRTLPSFKEYVLVNQFKPLVNDYFLQDEKEGLWKISSADSLEAKIVLPSIGFELSLADIYWMIPELQGELWEGN